MHYFEAGVSKEDGTRERPADRARGRWRLVCESSHLLHLGYVILSRMKASARYSAKYPGIVVLDDRTLHSSGNTYKTRYWFGKFWSTTAMDN